MFRGAYGLAFSGDGARLAAACVDGTVKVWDAKTWQITAGLKGLEDATWHEAAVAFSADSRFLAGGNGRKVRVWDTATWKEIFSHDYPWE